MDPAHATHRHAAGCQRIGSCSHVTNGLRALQRRLSSSVEAEHQSKHMTSAAHRPVCGSSPLYADRRYKTFTLPPNLHEATNAAQERMSTSNHQMTKQQVGAEAPPLLQEHCCCAYSTHLHCLRPNKLLGIRQRMVCGSGDPFEMVLSSCSTGSLQITCRVMRSKLFLCGIYQLRAPEYHLMAFAYNGFVTFKV